MTGRSFLLGLAIGILIGIYAAPIVTRQDLGLPESVRTALPLSGLKDSALDAARWPSDKIAKSELFRISNWDISIHGTGSTVAVKRCISVGKDSIACELAVRLGWVDGESFLKQFSKESRETGEWSQRSRGNLLSTEELSTLARSEDCTSTSPAESTKAPTSLRKA